MATTGMNEYWMNDLSQPQNSQSSFGTMKNGTKIGPSRPQTALAIRPNAITASDKLDRNLFERYGDVQAFAKSDPATALHPGRLNQLAQLVVPVVAPVALDQVGAATGGKGGRRFGQVCERATGDPP